MGILELNEPLDFASARRLALRGLGPGGALVYTKHAKQRMSEREVSLVDIVNVIRGGRVVSVDPDNRGGWTYRIESQRMAVVVAFADGGAKVVLATAMRLGGQS